MIKQRTPKTPFDLLRALNSCTATDLRMVLSTAREYIDNPNITTLDDAIHCALDELDLLPDEG